MRNVVILLTGILFLSCSLSPVFQDLGDADLLEQNITATYGDYFPLQKGLLFEYKVTTSYQTNVDVSYDIIAFTNSDLYQGGKIHVYGRVHITGIDVDGVSTNYAYFVQETADELLFWNAAQWDRWMTKPPLRNETWSYTKNGEQVSCQWTYIGKQRLPYAAYYNCWGVIRQRASEEVTEVYAPNIGLVAWENDFTRGGTNFHLRAELTLMLNDYNDYDEYATWHTN